MLLRSSSTRQLHLQLAASIGSQWMERFGLDSTEAPHTAVQCICTLHSADPAAALLPLPLLLLLLSLHCCSFHHCCCCRLPAAVTEQERPSLSVLFPVVNRCVDPGGRVHTTQITNWVYGSSRLSSAVAEAVAALSEVAPGTLAAAGE
jgi:hypothetical protein